MLRKHRPSMTSPLSSRVLPFLAISTLLSAPAWADVRLPAVISDNMVLQAEAKANVWGWADPGEKVTAKFGGQSLSTEADTSGAWSIKFDEMKPGTTGELAISGKNALTIKNVLVGEVWVCSGQSNMEFVTRNAVNAAQEIAEAKFPEIRMFTVKRDASTEAKQDCMGKWEVCSPETVGAFSAVGYFFGRKLHQDLKVPVGLIHTSWGGTPAEYWTPPQILNADPEFQHFASDWEKTKANYPKAKEQYDKDLAAWKEVSEKAKAEGKPVPQQPRAPKGNDAVGSPGCLFNAMIAPLVPYTIQGAIWYQGEANASRAKEYQRLFPTMIVSWRRVWGTEFPFLFVQLANFNARRVEPTGQPEDSQWAELREAQLLTLELPRTGMAVAIDIGEGNDIHPKNKQEVGRRLALSAEAQVYFREVEYSGPIISSSQEEEGKIRLSFRNAEGLKAADGGKIKGFAVAGEDRKFAWADVAIEGDHLVVSSSDVPKPVAVRYNWADNPSGNLVNSAGLPASPFRSDRWPQTITAPQK